MKQNTRRSVREFLFAMVIISAVFTLITKNVFSADYISEPELIDTEDVNPPIPVWVSVKLTASPEKGLVPLEVTFTCTAEAEIHYADERWAMPPQGSVENVVPLYKTVSAEITKCPDDQILMEPWTSYSFKAVAEYGGLQDEDSVVVETGAPRCWDKYQELQRLKEKFREKLEEISQLPSLGEQLEELERAIEALRSEIEIISERETGLQLILPVLQKKLGELESEYFDKAEKLIELKEIKAELEEAEKNYEDCLFEI